MPSMPITNGSLYYEEHGSGPPLLCAAGLGGVGAYWKPQIEALAPHFRVVLHDHRGTGKSSRDLITYSVAQMARDVLDLADGLGIDRFHFMGHSTGAAIGQELALNHGDRLLSAILGSGWAVADPHFLRCFETRKAILTQIGPAAYVRAQALFLYPPWWISSHHDAITEAEKHSLAEFPPVEIVLSRIAAITSYAPAEALARVTTPCLVTCAADDHLTPAHASEKMHALIPGSTLAILPSGAHFHTITQPAEYNETVLTWLLAQGDGTDWKRPAYAAAAAPRHD